MINGVLLIDRAMAEHWVWDVPKGEKATYGHAWMDLLLLANQLPTQIILRGQEVLLERGQVAWSKLSLADRWRWSQGKVARFLDLLQKHDMVRIESSDQLTTLLTVINFDGYQRTLGEQTVNRQRPDGEQTVTEKGVGKGSTEEPTKGVGKGNRTGNHPDFVSVVRYLQEMGADYSNGEIRDVWNEFEQAAVDGQWMTLKGQARPVTDWRAAFELRLSERRSWQVGKNGAKKSAAPWEEQRRVREALAAAREQYHALAASLDEMHPDVRAAYGRVQALEEQQQAMEVAS